MNGAQGHYLETLPPQDAARADVYAALAVLLASPPKGDTLRLIASAGDIAAGRESALAAAWRELQAAAARADAAAVQTEYAALFFAVGEPEVMLYASWYRTGFLMEEPLAQVRADLARLGFSRLQSVNEPEDHIAALCEAMRLLVQNDEQPEDARLAAQKQFFDRHLAVWHRDLARRIMDAESADFYRRVAGLMQAFFEAEAAHLELYVGSKDPESVR
jgi:TorA maturation chaperone TorD